MSKNQPQPLPNSVTPGPLAYSNGYIYTIASDKKLYKLSTTVPLINGSAYSILDCANITDLITPSFNPYIGECITHFNNNTGKNEMYISCNIERGNNFFDEFNNYVYETADGACTIYVIDDLDNPVLTTFATGLNSIRGMQVYNDSLYVITQTSGFSLSQDSSQLVLNRHNASLIRFLLTDSTNQTILSFQPNDFYYARNLVIVDSYCYILNSNNSNGIQELVNTANYFKITRVDLTNFSSSSSYILDWIDLTSLVGADGYLGNKLVYDNGNFYFSWYDGNLNYIGKISNTSPPVIITNNCLPDFSTYYFNEINSFIVSNNKFYTCFNYYEYSPYNYTIHGLPIYVPVDPTPLPKGVTPGYSFSYNNEYIYMIASDRKLYQISTAYPTINGQSYSILDCSSIDPFPIITTYSNVTTGLDEIYIANTTNTGETSIYVIYDVNDPVLTLFTSGLDRVGGMQVYNDKLYVLTGDLIIDYSQYYNNRLLLRPSVSLIQISLTDPSNQTKLTFNNNEFVNPGKIVIVDSYCYITNSFSRYQYRDDDLPIFINNIQTDNYSRITRVDLTNFSSSSNYILNWIDLTSTVGIYGALIANIQYDNGYFYFDWTTGYLGGGKIYIGKISNTSPPVLVNSNYITDINLDNHVDFAVSNGHFYIQYDVVGSAYDYTIHGLPIYSAPDPTPLPNSVIPGPLAYSNGYIYTIGSDNQLYKLSTTTAIPNGSATPFLDGSTIFNKPQYITIYFNTNTGKNEMYISDVGPSYGSNGNGSIYVIIDDLENPTINPFVTGINNPGGLQVYNGYLYVITQTYGGTDVMGSLVQYLLTDPTNQTILSFNSNVDFSRAGQLVVVDSYCYFMNDQSIVRVDLTDFSPSSSYNYQWVIINNLLPHNLAERLLVYNDGYFYIAVTNNSIFPYPDDTIAKISNTTPPVLISSNCIPEISASKHTINITAIQNLVSANNNFYLTFFDYSIGQYTSIYGLPVYVASPTDSSNNSNNSIPCFNEDTKILTDKGYIAIQDLRKGDFIKTLNHDFKQIDMIGKREIYHAASKDRIKDQLYKCSQIEYPEIFEDLLITGCHSILVDNFACEEQKEKVIEVNRKIYVTDGKYRLPACADNRASIYETPGNYTIYHLALENEDYYMNYGIFANGLLVETCSKRYLKELSNMTLIE